MVTLVVENARKHLKELEERVRISGRPIGLISYVRRVLAQADRQMTEGNVLKHHHLFRHAVLTMVDIEKRVAT